MTPSEPQYDIGYVSRVTGLSTHLLRAWEKRYGTVTPVRTNSNRRLYTRADIERLRLISRLSEVGHRISLLSPLGAADLRRLGETAGMSDLRRESATHGVSQETHDAHLSRCSQAVTVMQPELIDRCLRRAAADLSRLNFLASVVAPLLENIGQRWARGELGIAHEHLAVSIIKGLMLECLRSAGPHPNAPVAVAGTLAGQHCELGALMASVVAADSGWRVLYLGPDLPAEEIAAAAKNSLAEAVLLSIVMETPQDELIFDLSRLKRSLGADVAVHAGGRGVAGCRPTLRELGISWHGDIYRLSGPGQSTHLPNRRRIAIRNGAPASG